MRMHPGGHGAAGRGGGSRSGDSMFYPGSSWFLVFLPVFEPPLPTGAELPYGLPLFLKSPTVVCGHFQ